MGMMLMRRVRMRAVVRIEVDIQHPCKNGASVLADVRCCSCTK